MADLTAMGMRELLLAAAALVALYLLLLVLRLRRPKPPVVRLEPDPLSLPPRVEPARMDLEISDADFAAELAKSSLTVEVQQLRRDVAGLREDLAALGEEVRQLKATHNVSPVYSEAMRLAERGELPDGIAARCGISVGEAELVAALARREFGSALASELDASGKETDTRL